MTETIYVCEGTCEGKATQQEFEEAGGELKCQAKECNLHDQPLTKYSVCGNCSERFKADQEHECKKE